MTIGRNSQKLKLTYFTICILIQAHLYGQRTKHTQRYDGIVNAVKEMFFFHKMVVKISIFLLSNKTWHFVNTKMTLLIMTMPITLINMSDISCNEITYNITKCNITYMFFNYCYK